MTVLGFSVRLAIVFACALLAALLFAHVPRPYDDPVRQMVHAHSSPAMTSIMRVVTFMGSMLFICLASAATTLALWTAGRRYEALILAVTVSGGILLLDLAKFLVHRPRPQPYFDTPLPDSSSFPSGHALVSLCFCAAAATVICTRQKNRWIRIATWTIAMILVFAIGLSRIYLGVHYPSDVVGGYLAGLIWVLGVAITSKRFQSSNP